MGSNSVFLAIFLSVFSFFSSAFGQEWPYYAPRPVDYIYPGDFELWEDSDLSLEDGCLLLNKELLEALELNDECVCEESAAQIAQEKEPVEEKKPADSDDNKENKIPLDQEQHPYAKTELCKNWKKNGVCNYEKHTGKKCAFAHGESDLSKKVQLPKSANYKTIDCKHYRNPKLCLYGKRCQYRHPDDTMKLP